ncbi:MAG: hypothetical protein Q7T39_25765 [Polaromonas sp.]|nr:hypothetical protein [Polaromonas sp.]
MEQERFERRLRQKAKKHRKNQRASGSENDATRSLHARRKSWKSTDRWTDIEVPIDIDLGQNREATCEFIQLVRTNVRRGVRLRMLFDKCRSIKLSALVLLLAQIHKLRLEFGVDHITGTYPESPRVERLLADSGFYKLLQVKSRKSAAPASKLTRFIRFKSDQKPNSSEIPNLRNELLGDDLQMPSVIARLIFRGLSEAMTNVNHHAYKTKSVTVSSLGGRWWVVANVSARTRLFTLAFYDAGVGIPKTLPRKYPMEKIRGVLSLLPGIQPDDGQMIHAAMELGRTRTDASNRGKGLMDLAKLIDTAGAGSMQIHSRNGSYTYAPSKESHQNHGGFVEGTLIEWQLPIDKALNGLPQELADELTAQN